MSLRDDYKKETGLYAIMNTLDDGVTYVESLTPEYIKWLENRAAVRHLSSASAQLPQGKTAKAAEGAEEAASPC